MAKQNETPNSEATSALYKVTYTHLTDSGEIRSGAMVVDTTSAEEAKAHAAKTLAASALRHPRINKVKAY